MQGRDIDRHRDIYAYSDMDKDMDQTSDIIRVLDQTRIHRRYGAR